MEETPTGYAESFDYDGPEVPDSVRVGNAALDAPRLASPTLAEIPMRLNLQVRFNLQPNEATK